MNQVKFYTLLLCLVAFSQIAFAQNNPTLNVQGVLRNTNGTSVDNGTYKIKFSLYTTETGGTPVWSETQDSVLVSGGIYTTSLGKSTPMTAAFDQTYYLGMKVGAAAEIVPRALLSSAPYALALIGQGNIFPSSGAIGVGTNTPTAGYQLHSKNSAGDGKMLLEGSTASLLDFKKGAITGSIGFGTANNNFVLNPGANNTNLQYNGTTKLTVSTNGADVTGTLTANTLTATTVNATTLNATNFTYSPANFAVTSKLAVGQSSVDASNALKVVGNSLLTGRLDITGSNTNWGSQTYVSYDYACTVCPGSGATNASLNVDNGVLADYFLATSDRRIKKDLRLSDKTADLSLLQKLRVTDYRHVDVVQKGTAFTKGLIAQEVKEVYPEAVKVREDFVPDVYALSTATRLSGGQMTISLEKKHGFAIGDEVKLMSSDGEKVVIVSALPTENTFTMAWDAAAEDKVFVYGKKVKDFHAVDYDRLYTLNISATQELARKVELLEKENAALKTKNGALEASVEKFEARLRTIESKLSN